MDLSQLTESDVPVCFDALLFIEQSPAKQLLFGDSYKAMTLNDIAV